MATVIDVCSRIEDAHLHKTKSVYSRMMNSGGQRGLGNGDRLNKISFD